LSLHSGTERERIKELQEKAVRYFCDQPSNFPIGRPFNCCESVLLALKDYGAFMGVGSDWIPKIGTCIGAGVSLNGLLCGAVSSVAMAIGIICGRNNPEKSPQPIWDVMDKYIAEFREKFGNVDCRHLTGLDLKTEKGLKEYYEKVHDQACTARIRFAVKKTVEILDVDISSASLHWLGFPITE